MPNNSEGIGTKVSVKGDKEYKSALQQISRQLTVLNTDMKASQSAFGAQAETMDGMHDRLEKLNEIYEVQAKKVELIREQLEKAKAEYGENSKQADDLQIALNKATAQMNGTANQITTTEQGLKTLADAQHLAGDATDASSMTLKEAEQALKNAGEGAEEMAGSVGDAGDAAGEVGDAAEDASGGVGSFAESLLEAAGAVGGGFLDGVQGLLGALGSIGGACVEALGEAFDLAKDAGKYADDLLTLSSQVGVDTDKLQQWQYASNFIDTSVETITGSMTKLTKKMDSAQEEEKKNAEKWQEHLDKIARGEKDTWSEVTTARDAFVKLGVSWKDYNGNLRDNEEVFMDLIDALGKVENPVERDALAMELFGKSAKELNPLIEAGSRAWREMGQEAEAMGTVFSEGNLEIMGGFDDTMQMFNATADAMKKTIGLKMIPMFEPLVQAAGQSMGRLSKALQDGASPTELAGVLDEVANSLIDELTVTFVRLDEMVPEAVKVISQVISHVAEALPELARVALPGAMKLLQAVLDGLLQITGPLATLATELVTTVAGFLIDNLPDIVDAGTDLLLGLVDGIVDALPELIPAAVEMVVKLAEGLIQAIPKLVEKLPEIVDAIWDGLVNTDWPGLGSEVLSSIWGTLGALGDDLLGIFTDAITNITGLDFASIGSGIQSAIEGILGSDGSFLSGLFSDAHDDIEGIDWDKLGENVGKAGSALVNMTGEALAGGFEAGYALIENIEWGKLGETVGNIANGLVNLTGEVAAAGFEAAHGLIEGLDWEGLGKTVGDVGNGLVNLTGEVAAQGFQNAHDLIENIDWSGLTDTLAAVPNGLIELSGDLIAQGFRNGHDLIEKINWGGLTDTLAAVPNGLIELSGETLSGAFSAAYDIISDIPWDELGNEVADGLGRAWGIVSGVGDVALGLGEGAVMAGQQGVGALKDWIASWRDDGEVESEATAVGAQVITDVGTGVTNEVPQLETTAQEAADALLTAIRNVLTESTVEQIGKDLDEDVWTGVVLGEDELLQVVAGVAGDSFDELRDAVEDAGFAEIGRQMDNGIVSGIYENSRYIKEAARAAAQAAYNAAKSELGIASPSKKGGWLGEMFDLGFAGGLIDNADEIESAMGYLNELTTAEAEPVMVGGPMQRGFAGFEIDYGQMREAFIEAIEETGVGNMVMQMDKEVVGETLEPVTSRATRQRQQRYVKGRTARLVIG